MNLLKKSALIPVPAFMLAAFFLIGPAKADPPGVPPPAPFGPVPDARQLRWQGLHVYAFIHFTVNTFTGSQWGGGDEDPSVFNPTAFDADQIARTVHDAGMTGLILTCKHHDGFCLWPSAYTGHSVKHSPWRGGHGDVVKELSDACHRQDILFGVYLSPWDRNRADYGRPEYIQYYRDQIRELLTGYGPIFEMWFDGANGGTGYYGGARERRTIDASTYYDWPGTFALIHQLQPDTIIWTPNSQGDVQWGGSESGTVGDPCWATDGHNGHDGKKWVPKEADVSLRRDWFYNPSPAQEASIKTPAQLMDIYFKSVGRGANLILNLPPDRRGIIPETDVAALHAWHAVMQETFGTDLARGAHMTASNTRGNDPRYAPENLIDGPKKAAGAYWATDDQEKNPAFTADFGHPVRFNVIEMREYLPLGQRVGRVAIDRWDGSGWAELAVVPSIGSQRLVHVPDTTSGKVRVRVLEAAASPVISRFSLYYMPPIEVPEASNAAPQK
jgi:alpha-L-fucosidase